MYAYHFDGTTGEVGVVVEKDVTGVMLGDARAEIVAIRTIMSGGCGSEVSWCEKEEGRYGLDNEGLCNEGSLEPWVDGLYCGHVGRWE